MAARGPISAVAPPSTRPAMDQRGISADGRTRCCESSCSATCRCFFSVDHMCCNAGRRDEIEPCASALARPLTDTRHSRSSYPSSWYRPSLQTHPLALGRLYWRQSLPRGRPEVRVLAPPVRPRSGSWVCHALRNHASQKCMLPKPARKKCGYFALAWARIAAPEAHQKSDQETWWVLMVEDKRYCQLGAS